MTAAVLVLGPIFEADLQPEQYAYRSERGALDAVRQVLLAWARHDPRSKLALVPAGKFMMGSPESEKDRTARPRRDRFRRPGCH
jgi:hypothetical protein